MEFSSMCQQEQNSDFFIRRHLLENAHIAFTEVRTDKRSKTTRVFGTHFVDVTENPEGTVDKLRDGSFHPNKMINAYTWDGHHMDAKVYVRVRVRDIIWLGRTPVFPAYQPNGYALTRLLPWALTALVNATGLAHDQ